MIEKYISTQKKKTNIGKIILIIVLAIISLFLIPFPIQVNTYFSVKSRRVGSVFEDRTPFFSFKNGREVIDSNVFLTVNNDIKKMGTVSFYGKKDEKNFFISFTNGYIKIYFFKEDGAPYIETLYLDTEPITGIWSLNNNIIIISFRREINGDIQVRKNIILRKKGKWKVSSSKNINLPIVQFQKMYEMNGNVFVNMLKGTYDITSYKKEEYLKGFTISSVLNTKGVSVWQIDNKKRSNILIHFPNKTKLFFMEARLSHDATLVRVSSNKSKYMLMYFYNHILYEVVF